MLVKQAYRLHLFALRWDRKVVWPVRGLHVIAGEALTVDMSVDYRW